jgi:hypothetical protein
VTAVIEAADRRRIRQLTGFIQAHDTADLLGLVAPRLDRADVLKADGMCAFAHAGMLIFPSRLDEATWELAGLGLRAGPLVPSMIVRQRLIDRYGQRDGLEVRITHAGIGTHAGGGTHAGSGARHGELELFLGCPAAPAMADDERKFNRELHFGFAVRGSADMTRLWDLLTGTAQLIPDGGGHNPHEDSAAGGRTILYFRGTGHIEPHAWPRRMELLIGGYHPELLSRHEQASQPHFAGMSR